MTAARNIAGTVLAWRPGGTRPGTVLRCDAVSSGAAEYNALFAVRSAVSMAGDCVANVLTQVGRRADSGREMWTDDSRQS